MQEAFSAILPYFLLVSLITLVAVLMETLSFSHEILHQLAQALSLFTSVVIVISVAYAFARRFKVSTIIAITLSLSTYVSSLILEGAGTVLLVSEGSYGYAFQPLVMPILSTWMLHLYYPRLSLNIPLQDANAHVYRLFNYLPAFMLAYITVFFVYLLVDFVVDSVVDELFEQIVFTLSPIVSLGLREFAVHTFWALGLHGDYTVNAILGNELLQTPLLNGLTVDEFTHMFVTLGGSGAGIGLLLALLRYTKGEMIRLIAKLSIPLVAFNISTLLIYAIVVFNRFLILPFLFVPLLNMLISYAFLQLVPVTFSGEHIAWSTPIFIDSILKSDQSLLLIALQASLVVVDTLIYGYFVRRYVESQSPCRHIEHMHTKLNIPYAVRATQHVESFLANQEIIFSNAKLEEILDELHEKNMLLYYQPKMSVDNGSCTQFEALLRYKDGDEVKGPFFLDIIEKARMAHIIDLWVAERVRKDLEIWKEDGFEPMINMNLHPDTLSKHQILSQIIGLLKGYHIHFEIIERSFVSGSAAEGIEKLKEAGFKISIDDYGIGYSNIETLIRHPITELKIDREILLLTEQEAGKKAYRHIVSLGKEMGFDIVAEGAESKEQVTWLSNLGVDYIQGFHISRAIPFEEVHPFTRDFVSPAY